jgi:hypothetical protein
LQAAQPKDWPFASLPDLVFGDEKADWVGGWLSVAGLPKAFTTVSGADLCGLPINGTARNSTISVAIKPAGLRGRF